MTNTGMRIKELRRGRGVTQEQFAAVLAGFFTEREENGRSVPEKYRMISKRHAECRYEIWRAACLRKLGSPAESEAALEKARGLADSCDSVCFREALRYAGLSEI